MNAVKYGDPKTPLTVELTASETEITLSVHNEGKPIPTHHHSKLFTPFERVSAKDEQKPL